MCMAVYLRPNTDSCRYKVQICGKCWWWFYCWWSLPASTISLSSLCKFVTHHYYQSSLDRPSRIAYLTNRHTRSWSSHFVHIYSLGNVWLPSPWYRTTTDTVEYFLPPIMHTYIFNLPESYIIQLTCPVIVILCITADTRFRNMFAMSFSSCCMMMMIIMMIYYCIQYILSISQWHLM